jgi:multidrug resistance efflux pump
MKTITHEGVEYVLKADIESAFKDRISKLSARAIQAEEQAKALQEQMDNQSGELEKISKLQEKVSTLEQSLQDAESKYSRVSMLSEQGFTDPELREAVEWAYQRSKTEATLEDWIKGIKEKPEEAPLVLRPHLQAKKAPEVSTETAEASPMVTEAAPAPEAPTLLPPKTNTGAKPAPVQSGDILSRISDPEFYRANREEIQKAWKAQRRTTL